MPRSPGHTGRAGRSRPVVPRRPLLAAAGLVLLAGCESGPGTARHGAARPSGPPHSPDDPDCPSGPVPQFYLHDGPKTIALTIDDGPDPRYTPQVLDVLAEQGVTATFCVIGEHAQSYPELIRQVVEGGHGVANHTWSHPEDLGRLSPAQVDQELRLASDMIEQATQGTRPAWFRAPGGSFSPRTLASCERLGMRPLAWSVDPHDWKRPGADRIVSTVLRATRTGSIILNHDGGGDRSETVAALRVYLPRLREAGFRFGKPTPEPPPACP